MRGPQLGSIRDQHDLMVSVLRQAGGMDANGLAPEGYSGKIADVIFKTDRLIVEVKSITADRRKSYAVQERLGAMIHDGAAKYGGPVLFGTANIRIDQLPEPLATRALREIGERVLKEVRAANKQITATAKALGWTEYWGVVAFIAPPDIMPRDMLGWLVHNAVKDGDHPAVNCLMIGSTPLRSGPNEDGDSYISFHGRDGYELGLAVRQKIGMAWAFTHGGPWRIMSAEEWMEDSHKR